AIPFPATNTRYASRPTSICPRSGGSVPSHARRAHSATAPTVTPPAVIPSGARDLARSSPMPRLHQPPPRFIHLHPLHLPPDILHLGPCLPPRQVHSHRLSIYHEPQP